MTHTLDSLTEFFEPTMNGLKKHEIRPLTDYPAGVPQVGDTVMLVERGANGATGIRRTDSRR